MQITQAANGYIISNDGTDWIAGSIEEAFDYLLLQFEGRTAVPGTPDRYGTVIIVRCKCFQMNSEGLERRNAVAGCSNCSERLAVLV